MIHSAPKLSVILAATRPWEELAACLRRIAPQLDSAQAEVIVGDAHSGAIPRDIEIEFPQVQWIRRPGESVFYLRNLAVLAARGPIVAITEDHCLVAPDWCHQILKAHRDQPEAAAIGGSVANGPTRHLIDWANYLVVFAPFLPPAGNRASSQISLQANSSYKRDALPDTLSPNGLMEFHLNRALLAQGRMLYTDGNISVEHVQSHGRLGTFAAHFHNGRSIATVRMETLRGPQRLLRIASCFVLPAFLFAYVARHVASKPAFWGRYLSSVHLIAGLNLAHAAGEFLGYTVGPGSSMESMP